MFSVQLFLNQCQSAHNLPNTSVLGACGASLSNMLSLSLLAQSLELSNLKLAGSPWRSTEVVNFGSASKSTEVVITEPGDHLRSVTSDLALLNNFLHQDHWIKFCVQPWACSARQSIESYWIKIFRTLRWLRSATPPRALNKECVQPWACSARQLQREPPNHRRRNTVPAHLGSSSESQFSNLVLAII